MSRLGKQFLYGFGFLIILALIGGIISFVFLYSSPTCNDNQQNQDEQGIDCGGSCVSCELKNAKAIRITPAEIFDLDGKSTVLFSLINSNPNLGIPDLPYTINIYNKDGDKAFFFNRGTFIYADEEKNIMEVGVNIKANLIGRAELILNYDQNSWKFSEEFSPPPIKTKEITKEFTENTLIIKGKMDNENAFPLQQISVSATIANKLGLNISASQTVIGAITSFASRDFELRLPFKPEQKSELDPNKITLQIEGKK